MNGLSLSTYMIPLEDHPQVYGIWYSFELRERVHGVTLHKYNLPMEHFEVRTPGEVVNHLAPFRSSPLVCELIEWLVNG